MAADAKERLLMAAEHLFARAGVQGTRVRDLNALANQRNSSALHYHFGSRDGLLQAITRRHSGPVDSERGQLLAALPEPAELRDLVSVILTPLAEELSHPSGRDYLRIVPQNVDASEVPPAILQAFGRAEKALSWLPPTVCRERLGSMFLAASTLLAARAARIEDGRNITLTHQEFVANLINMMTAMLAAPAS